jgi:hypothetical protein
LIDAAAQNAFLLFRLQNEEQIDMLWARQNQLEKLGIDLIKFQVKDRYEIAYEEKFNGRKIIFIKKMELFLEQVKKLNKIIFSFKIRLKFLKRNFKSFQKLSVKSPKESKNGQCKICEKERRCSKRCSNCQNFVCMDHLEIYCENCV